jgi:prevent-host-death family protein
MKIAPLADVKARLSAYLDEAKTDGPVIITRNGKAVAVLITPQDDDDLEHLVLSRSRRFQALLAQSRQSLQAGQGLPADDFWRAVEQRTAKRSRGKATAGQSRKLG